MSRILLLTMLLLPAWAHAQTAGSLTDPVMASPTNTALASKQDHNPLVAYLAAGQTEMQLTTGAINAQPALSAALAAGPVRLPCGIYQLATAVTLTGDGINLPSKLLLDGGNPDCVTFNVTFATGDIFLLTNVGRGTLSNFTIKAAIQRTSGAAVHLLTSGMGANSFGNTLDGIVLTGPHGGDGFLLDAAIQTVLSRFDCRPPSVDGSSPIGPTQYGAGACVHVTNNALDANISHGNSYGWTYGLQLTDSGGGYADHLDFIQSLTGVDINPSNAAGQTVWSWHLTDVDSDTSYSHNFLVEGDGPVNDIYYTAGWFSTSISGHGIMLDNPRLNSIQFAIPTILNNYHNGLLHQQGTNVTVVGAAVENNSVAGSGIYHGIVQGPQAGTLGVIGGHSGPGGRITAIGGVNKQGYGFFQTDGATAGQSVKLIGLDTQGNVSGGTLVQPATGNYTNNYVAGGDSAAWTSMAETPTPASGSFTGSGLISYTKSGRTVTINININISTNGTGAGAIYIPIPFVPAAAATLSGRQAVPTGRGVTGFMNAGTSSLVVTFSSDNSYPGADGAALVLSGTYETSD